MPSVAFAGEHDGGFDDIGTYDRAASWYSGSYRVIRMPGGHFLHREDPDRFNQELLGALG